MLYLHMCVCACMGACVQVHMHEQRARELERELEARDEAHAGRAQEVEDLKKQLAAAQAEVGGGCHSVLAATVLGS